MQRLQGENLQNEQVQRPYRRSVGLLIHRATVTASGREGGRRIFRAVALQLFMGLLVTLAVAVALPIQAAQARSYAGRPVSDILQELQTAELRIIFSTDLVKSAMRVQAEPKSTDPKDIAREILEPHGLTVRPGPRGTLLVVALPRKDPPASRRTPPAAPTRTPQPPAEPQKPEEALRIEEEVNVIDRLGERMAPLRPTRSLRPRSVRPPVRSKTSFSRCS